MMISRFIHLKPPHNRLLRGHNRLLRGHNRLLRGHNCLLRGHNRGKFKRKNGDL
jgi:hypothetical protein